MEDRKQGIARRLRDVGSENDAKTARKFWLRLGDVVADAVVWKDRAGRTRSISYASVKNYLTPEAKRRREAPGFFLERVAEVFGYRFEWLSTGQGPRTEAEAQRREEARAAVEASEAWKEEPRTDAQVMDDLFRGTRAGWLLFDESTRWRLAEVFARWYTAHEQQVTARGQTTDVREAAEVFAGLIARPVMHWYEPTRYMMDIHPDRLIAYVNAQLHALSLAIPDSRDFNLTPLDQEP